MTTKIKNLIRLLSVLPVSTGLIFGALQYLDIKHTSILLKGVLVVLIGGILEGWVAKRYLNEEHNTTKIVIALAIVSFIGLVSVGIVYFALLPDPIRTVMDPQRATTQVLIFLEYLAAVGVGITLSRV